jgi:hypothetical protein
MTTRTQRTRASPERAGRLDEHHRLPKDDTQGGKQSGNQESPKERKYTMKHFNPRPLIATLCLAGLAAPALAYDSGSTGADGAFSPTVNTELQIPESGVFNFTTVNIPTGVTVTFRKNTSNTPVVMLASGNVTVAGTVNVSGGNATNSGAAGDGNIGDDGMPGVGGPGGYDGGRGGLPGKLNGGSGLGPGGGGGGSKFTTGYWTSSGDVGGGGGGGFSAAGGTAPGPTSATGIGGPVYGSSQLLPLIGGSGGGGGAGGTAFAGAGGGGGGGAILIASSGAVSITGSLLADGGTTGTSAGDSRGASGGSASGGAIRVVATAISGNGTISAKASTVSSSSSSGSTGSPAYYVGYGADGAPGRIRFEAETFTRTAASNPVHTFGSPSSVFVAGMPTLRIASVAGVAAPANPTGNADITLPSSTPNPVTVAFATTGVPVGNTVSLRVTPAYGNTVTVVSPAITGSTSAGTASVSATLPSGPSVLSASTTYTIVTAMGEALSIYAQGERVEKVRLSTTMNGPTLATLITVSGKEFSAPQAVLAMIGG